MQRSSNEQEPRSKTVKLWVFETTRRSDAGLVLNLMERLVNSERELFGGFVCHIVDVAAHLKDDVAASRGPNDKLHARFLRFAISVVASAFTADQNF